MHHLFGNTANEPSHKTFEIQLDSDQIVLYGDAYEAEDTYLRGKLVFHNTAPIKVPSVKISFIGEYYVNFSNGINRTYHPCQQGQLHKQETILCSDPSALLPPGNHSWPFEFPIKGHQLETLQGMSETFFTYRLKAVVERGSFVKDHKAYRRVRIIRTHEATSLALNQSMSVDKTWPEKVKYSLTTRSKAAVFGSLVPCELSLIPLVKGLRIGKISITLVEDQEFHMKPEAGTLVPRLPIVRQLYIISDHYDVPEETTSEEIDGLEGFKFTRQLQIPRDLASCRLSTDPVLPHESTIQPYPLVRIKHSLKFVIALINADGHISEIRARLPISLFLTPNQRLNAKHQLMNSGVLSMSNNPDIIASEFGAPPSYGQHQTDETLDATSLVNSGLATPDGFISSHNSSNNLQALLSSQQTQSQQIPANVLYSRLVDLQRASPQQTSLDTYLTHQNGSTAGSASDEQSRLPSGSQTPAHIEYDTIALSRVPSYNTANRSSPPHHDSHIGLPTYNQIANDERSGRVQPVR